jgi:hypothetical protein
VSGRDQRAGREPMSWMIEGDFALLNTTFRCYGSPPNGIAAEGAMKLRIAFAVFAGATLIAPAHRLDRYPAQCPRSGPFATALCKFPHVGNALQQLLLATCEDIDRPH